MTEALKEMFLNMTISSLQSFDDMIVSSENVLSQGLEVWTTVEGMASILKPVCYTIIAICLLIEIAQVAMKVDLMKWEHGLKLGVKMVFAKVCIDIAPEFLRACYLQSASWVSGMANSNLGGDVALGTFIAPHIEKLMENISGLGNMLGLFASLIIVVIGIKICGLLVQVIAYGRIFELYIYLAVSPLPCAFFPLGDGSGGGFNRITTKFFKAFAAICLQGVMMMLCLRLFGVIIGNAFMELVNDAINSGASEVIMVADLCYTMLLGTIVLVMSVAKCGSWAKNILDSM